jgi:hypothetical protein
MGTSSKDELRKIAEADDLHISPFREDGVTYGNPNVDLVRCGRHARTPALQLRLIQPIQYRLLAFENFRLRVRAAEPSAAIRFGEVLKPARPWRPFHGESVTDKRLRIAVTFHGISHHVLAAWLSERAEKSEVAV